MMLPVCANAVVAALFWGIREEMLRLYVTSHLNGSHRPFLFLCCAVTYSLHHHVWLDESHVRRWEAMTKYSHTLCETSCVVGVVGSLSPSDKPH